MTRAFGRRRLHLAAAIGNGLEWFDFAVYGSFAADLGRLFFPRFDDGLQLIVSFGVFAAGYLMRPVGSLVLGPVVDLLGRRPMLITSEVVMGVCSLLIGLLPTYASWGAWATLALLALRTLQGLSVGAEYTGSITFVVENSLPTERGWRAAVTASGSIAGFVLVQFAISRSLDLAGALSTATAINESLGIAVVQLRAGSATASEPAAACNLA